MIEHTHLSKIADASGEALRALLSDFESCLHENPTAITEESKDSLAKTLTAKFRNESKETQIRIVWVLGKLCLPSLTSFYESILKEELKSPSDLLWQAIVAIDNLDLPILSDTGGGGILDRKENIEIARRFLQMREGKK